MGRQIRAAGPARRGSTNRHLFHPAAPDIRRQIESRRPQAAWLLRRNGRGVLAVGRRGLPIGIFVAREEGSLRHRRRSWSRSVAGIYGFRILHRSIRLLRVRLRRISRLNRARILNRRELLRRWIRIREAFARQIQARLLADHNRSAIGHEDRQQAHLPRIATDGVPREPEAIRMTEHRRAGVGRQLFAREDKLLRRRLLLRSPRIVESVDDELSVDEHWLVLAVVEVDPAAEAARGRLAGRVECRLGPDGNEPIGHLRRNRRIGSPGQILELLRPLGRGAADVCQEAQGRKTQRQS